MKYIDWNQEKSELLRDERDIGFEDIDIALEAGKILAVLKHPNSKQYPNQELLVVEVAEYAYIVPFVMDDEKIFLKTIIPSRKATKKYLIDLL